MATLRPIGSESEPVLGAGQVKNGDVFTLGKRVTTEPADYSWPIIWEEEPGGDLVVRSVFEGQEDDAYPR